MKFLYLAGRETSYQRNNVLIRALQRIGEIEVVDLHLEGSIIRRTISAVFKSIYFIRRNSYDLIIVGFYGQLIMLSKFFWRGIPVIFDPFISTFDTLSFDRKLLKPNSIGGKMSFWIDKISCNLADALLFDTPQHKEYFQTTFDLGDKTQKIVPVSCNEDIFSPQPDISVDKDLVLFYCSHLPVHGVEFVIQAFEYLQNSINLRLRVIGDGPLKSAAIQLAKSKSLANVEFSSQVSIEALPIEIARAGICLGGHFGSVEKAHRVIPGKMYQLMAMSKAIVAADTPSNQDLLVHRKSAYLCSTENPQSLADAILTLRSDAGLRNQLGEKAKIRFDEVASEDIVYRKFVQLISEGV